MCNSITQAVVDIGTLPPMLSIRQTEPLLNVSGRTIYRMCTNGKLKAVKVNNVWRINRDALLEYAGLMPND